MSLNAPSVAAMEKAFENAEAQLTQAYMDWIGALINAAREPSANMNTIATVAESRFQETLSQFRATVNSMLETADNTANSGSVMDRLNQMVETLSQEKQILARLQSEAGTRVDQADSLNPKIRPSPYVNILGLERTFRDSTRIGILIASIVFGVLALATMGFLIYQVVASGESTAAPLITAVGGALKHIKGLGGGGVK
jgi:hypothetical protein